MSIGYIYCIMSGMLSVTRATHFDLEKCCDVISRLILPRFAVTSSDRRCDSANRNTAASRVSVDTEILEKKKQDLRVHSDCYSKYVDGADRFCLHLNGK